MERSGFYRRSRPSELGGSVAKGGRSQPSAGPALAQRGSPGGAGGGGGGKGAQHGALRLRATRRPRRRAEGAG